MRRDQEHAIEGGRSGASLARANRITRMFAAGKTCSRCPTKVATAYVRGVWWCADCRTEDRWQEIRAARERMKTLR